MSKYKDIIQKLIEHEAREDIFYLLRLKRTYNLKLSIEEIDVNLGEVSFEYFSRKNNFFKEIHSELEEIKMEDLNEKERESYWKVKDKLTYMNFDDSFFWYWDTFLGDSGSISKLPFLLSNLNFDDEFDVKCYILLLRDIPCYFRRILDYQNIRYQEKARICTWDVEQTIRMCESILSKNEFYLEKIMENKICNCNFLDNKEKNHYQKINREEFKTKILNAYQELADGLKSLLTKVKEENKYDESIQRLNYSTYVRANLGTQRTIEQLVFELESEINSNRILLGQLYSKLDANESENIWTEKVVKKIEGMADFKLLFSEDYPMNNLINYSIEYVDEVVGEYTPPAQCVYTTSNEACIYVNRKLGEEALGMYLACVHEIIPGHILQRSMYNDIQDELASFLGYVEGWATYCEQDSLKHLTCSDIGKGVIKTIYLLQSYAQARIDIGINYEMWDEEKYNEYVQNLGGITILPYNSFLQSPGEKIIYSYSMLRFIKIREKYKCIMKDNYTKKNFHTWILSLGGVSLDRLEKEVNSLYMSNKLPIEMPLIETYQATSFILSVILANNNIANTYYNNYINLVCNDTTDIMDIGLDFINVTWDDFRNAGFAEMDLYYLKNISKDKFLAFLKERIDQGNYILLYKIDEFYLSYTSNYNERHFIHDTYIYGYSEFSFYIMAYKDKKLQMIEISTEEIVEGMYSCLEMDEDASFCTFRPFHAVKVKLDYNKMKREIINYIGGNGNDDDKQVYGMKCYNTIKNAILAIAEDKNNIKNQMLDIRVFRMLWEHKKVLINHIEKVNERKKVDEKVIHELLEVENKANIVFLLSLKYNITYQKEILYNILDYIDKIKEKEIIAMKQIINEYF